jgi:uncharacterized protein (TIGR02466 family)
MQIISLFPTAVGMFHLGRDLTESEKGALLDLEMKPNMGNTTSADRFILRKEELKDLRAFIQTSIDTYFQEIVAPSKDVNLYITQSWVNYSKPGQWHHAHEHPNSFLSGVFYVQTDNSKDRIYFEKNHYDQISFPTEKFNLHNSKTWWLEATQGRLVIFPSSLRHSVSAVEADQTRVSLSFNTFAKGLIGSEENLTALEVGQIYN